MGTRVFIKVVLVLALVTMASGTVLRPLWDDEVVNLHASYLISIGEKPYLDFFQNHTPCLQWIVSPAMAFLPMGIGSIAASRLLVTLVLGAAFAILASLIPKGHRIYFGLLLFSTPVYWLSYHLRSDPFMVLFFALHLFCLARWKSTGVVSALVGAGIFMGLAATFLPKVALLAAGLPLLELKRRGLRASLSDMAVYAAATLVVPLLLALYLSTEGLFLLFLESVLTINLEPQSWRDTGEKLSAFLPNLPILLLMFSGMMLLRSQRASDAGFPLAGLIELYAVLALVNFFIAPFGWQYSLAVWVMCVAMLAGGYWREVVRRFQGRKKFVIETLMVLFLVLSPAHTFYRDLAQWTNTRLLFELFHELSSLVKRGDYVFAVAPLHPVFVRDAARIHHPWQLAFASWDERVKKRWFEGWIEGLSATKPSIVDPRLLRSAISLSPNPDFVGREAKRVLARLGYRERKVMGRSYLVPSPRD